jgi:Cytochrome P460
MKRIFSSMLITLLSINAAVFAAPTNPKAKPAPNGLTIPKGYEKWKYLAVSHRSDNNSLRVILGNWRAHRATYSQGKWNWPEGTILAKLVWRDSTHPQWPDAIVPGELQHIEFMVKDDQKFASTGGWGFARWVGMELKPYQNDGSECYSCHTKVRESDYVFTRPAPLP